MEDLNSGRSFTVNKNGTLDFFSKNIENSVLINNKSNKTEKAPMKVIICKAVVESFQKQIKYPAGRISQNNVNDSVNLRDFTHYGIHLKSSDNKKNIDHSNSISVDIRRWR